MKSIVVNGKNLKGKSFSALKGQIMAMNLDDAARDKALTAAGIAFPKKTRRGNGRGNATAKGTTPTANAKTAVEITRLKDGSHTLVVMHGPANQVINAARGAKNTRNIIHAEVETNVIGRQPKATIVALEGNVDRAKTGDVSKEMIAPYINQPGFSRLSSIKAVKAFKKNGYAAVGENLNKENVRRFVQALAAMMYDGAALRGATMGAENVSTNIFLATDTGRRQLAWWPIGKDGEYLALDIATKAGDPSVSYLGANGFFGITPDGQAFVTTFERALKEAAVAHLEGTLAKAPWQNLELGPEMKKLQGPFDVSVAQSTKDQATGKTTGYTVFVTGKSQLAILKFEEKEGGIVASPKAEIVPFESDMALLGFANDGATAVVMNRNGGTSLFGFRPVAEIDGLKDKLPAGIIAAQKVRAERIATKQAERQ